MQHVCGKRSVGDTLHVHAFSGSLLWSAPHQAAGQTGASPRGAVSLPPWIWARKKQPEGTAGFPRLNVAPGLAPPRVSLAGRAYSPFRMSWLVGLAPMWAAAAWNNKPAAQPAVLFGPSWAPGWYFAIAALNCAATGVLANHRKFGEGTYVPLNCGWPS